MILKTAYLRKGRGGRWRGVAELALPDGSTVQRSTTFETTRKREARPLLDAWAASLEGGEPEPPAGPPAREGPAAGASVADYVCAMVSSLGESGAIEASTVRDYRTTLSRIRKGLGDAGLSDLTPERVRRFEADLSRSGLSASSVGKAHRLLKQACGQAVAEGLMERNPCDAVKPPKRRNKAPGINYAPEGERRRLLEALEEAPMQAVTVAALTALYTGLREGEVCGLRWADADLGAGVLWVRRAVGVGPGGAYLKDAKDGEVRDAAMPGALALALARWRSRLGDPPDVSYVLTGTGSYMHPSTLCRKWRSVAEFLGLTGSEGRRLTFHDLRHTWATVAVAAGVDIKTVASNLGHANAAMTLNIYASADPQAKRRAAEVMGSAI